MQAKQSVEMMLALGILVKSANKYNFGDTTIDGNNVPVFLKKRTREETFQHVVHSLDSISPDQRFVTYTTFSADRKSYEKINELYKKFKTEMNDIILGSEKNDEVFQVTFSNIPVSNKERK